MNETKATAEDDAVLREESDLGSATDDYAARFAGEVGRWMLDTQTKAILPWLDSQCSGRILDVGGAHAQIALPLARAGRNVTVTGSVPACETWLRRRCGEIPVSFVAASSLRLPFADRSFNCALALRMLTHSADWRRLIAELCRVSRDCVILDYPTVNSLNRFGGSALFRLKKQVEKNTRPYRLFQDQEVADEFIRHGFSIGATKREFFWPMALHRMIGRIRISKFLNAISSVLGLKRCWGSPVILLARRKAQS